MYRPGIGEVELPNEIERALEERRLVFFCGAGISVYTRLPLFKGLVQKVFRTTYRPISKLSGDELEPAMAAYRANQFDRALGLLEQTLRPGLMRRAVIGELRKRFDGELFLHKAILDLARVPERGYHLVTTNFDARFMEAGLEEHWVHDAPRLAPPRPGDWHHATYLHGRIKADDPDGQELVLTSADFGRSYLQDGWAARFVVELFREFTVLFIGYSVEDPVMSYLVDALAAHRRHSRQFKSAYALVGFDSTKPEDRDVQVRDWRAKSIEPITFPMIGPKDYSAQETALVAWAEDHRLGLQSRISMALRATSQAYLQRDKEAEQVVWALSKHDGSIAKAFAGAEPPADPSWLRAFEEIEVPEEDNRQHKPTSFPSAPTDEQSLTVGGCPLVGSGAGHNARNKLSPVTHHIGVWISKHIDKEEVIQWVTRHHGILHPDFVGLIAWRMGQADYSASELHRRFWFIALLCVDTTNESMADLLMLSKAAPANKDLRRQVILHSLRSRLRMIRPYGSWFEDQTSGSKKLNDLARFEIDLTDQDGLVIGEESFITLTDEDLVDLSDDLTYLLVEALRLGKLAELPEASGHSDWKIRSIADYPAPAEHPERWMILVTLARDAFTALQRRDRRAARALFDRWMMLGAQPGFGLFLRLALIAATQADDLPLDNLIEALLAKDAAALWSPEFEEELAVFLRKRGPILRANGLLGDVLTAIREGPPETPSDD